MLVSDRHAEGERRGERRWGKRRESFLLFFSSVGSVQDYPSGERPGLKRRLFRTTLASCMFSLVCVCVCFPKSKGLMESAGHWLKSNSLSQHTDCSRFAQTHRNANHPTFDTNWHIWHQRLIIYRKCAGSSHTGTPRWPVSYCNLPGHHLCATPAIHAFSPSWRTLSSLGMRCHCFHPCQLQKWWSVTN